MVGIAADPVVRLLLTGVLCLVPTLAFLGLLRLLDWLRSDVLVEHTMRMAADEGATAEDVVTRAEPAAVVGSGGSRSGGSPTRAPAATDGDWSDSRRPRRLVLCSACATLRSPHPGSCPTCGAPLDEAADPPATDGGSRRP